MCIFESNLKDLKLRELAGISIKIYLYMDADFLLVKTRKCYALYVSVFVSRYINMNKAHPPELKKLMDKRLDLKLNGGRSVTGILRGFDPFMNLVVDDGSRAQKRWDHCTCWNGGRSWKFDINNVGSIGTDTMILN